jgi:hypothetical protein
VIMTRPCPSGGLYTDGATRSFDHRILIMVNLREGNGFPCGKMFIFHDSINCGFPLQSIKSSATGGETILREARVEGTSVEIPHLPLILVGEDLAAFQVGIRRIRKWAVIETRETCSNSGVPWL